MIKAFAISLMAFFGSLQLWGMDLNEIPKTIHQAIASGTIEQIGKFIDASPDLIIAVDALGRSPLHYAVTRADMEIVMILVNRGANINARAHDNSTPLSIAQTQIRELSSQPFQTPQIRAAETNLMAIAHELRSRGAQETLPVPYKQISPENNLGQTVAACIITAAFFIGLYSQPV